MFFVSLNSVNSCHHFDSVETLQKRSVYCHIHEKVCTLEAILMTSTWPDSRAVHFLNNGQIASLVLQDGVLIRKQQQCSAWQPILGLDSRFWRSSRTPMDSSWLPSRTQALGQNRPRIMQMSCAIPRLTHHVDGGV